MKFRLEFFCWPLEEGDQPEEIVSASSAAEAEEILWDRGGEYPAVSYTMTGVEHIMRDFPSGLREGDEFSAEVCTTSAGGRGLGYTEPQRFPIFVVKVRVEHDE